MEERLIVTIGRQTGSGGKKIGMRLAEKLGVKCYDKELLDHAAKESGLCKEIFEANDENKVKTSSFLYSLVMDAHSGYSTSLMSEMPLNQKVFLSQFDAIKKAAEEGPCIFVGRCADYALELDENLLSVFIYANMETRIRRIAKLYDLTNAKARDKITKIDKSRASYYNHYTSKKWGDINSYDLSVNSGRFGVDGAVEIIMKAVERRESENIHRIYEDPLI